MMGRFELYEWFINLFHTDKTETDDVKVWLRKQIEYPVSVEDELNPGVKVNTGLQIRKE